MEIVTLPLSGWFQQKTPKKIKSLKKARAALQPSSEPFYFLASERRGPIKYKISHKGNGKGRGVSYFAIAVPSLPSKTLPAKRTELESLATAVQKFVTSSHAFPEGTVISLAGKPLARLVPISPPATDDGEWTPAKNQRRCELVDRKIDRTITPEELSELEALTRQMRAFVRAVAPRPLDEIRQLHQELLEEAAKRRGSS